MVTTIGYGKLVVRLDHLLEFSISTKSLQSIHIVMRFWGICCNSNQLRVLEENSFNKGLIVPLLIVSSH